MLPLVFCCHLFWIEDCSSGWLIFSFRIRVNHHLPKFLRFFNIVSIQGCKYMLLLVCVSFRKQHEFLWCDFQKCHDISRGTPWNVVIFKLGGFDSVPLQMRIWSRIINSTLLRSYLVALQRGWRVVNPSKSMVRMEATRSGWDLWSSC